MTPATAQGEQQLVWVQNLIAFIKGQFPADERWKSIFVERLSICANNGWMPIDTAPHETRVLLWSPPTDFQEEVIEVGWASGGHRMGDYSNRWLHGSATKWQPLPKPPVE